MKENGLPNDNGGTEQARRVASLIAGFLRQTLSEKEHDELDAWVAESDENMQLFEELTDKKNIEAGLQQLKSFDTEKALERIKQKISFKDEKPKKSPVKFWPYAVAASVILVVALIFYVRYTGKGEKPGIVTVGKKDLPPGGNKATLTLSDGTILNLNETKNGLVKNESGTLIKKNADGELAYDITDSFQSETRYNLLVTPKGGQYKIQLPDGSLVWLNAAASLKYPVAFNSNERIVELTGEGYFEVAKDADKKFIVKLKDEASVEVLGTHFNIMAYDDEKNIETTLLEGSINLLSSTANTLIKPGSQWTIESNGGIKPNRDIDIESVVAWKNGVFKFKDATIAEIMKQVARWYDVDIVYEGTIGYHFNATIPRNIPVSRLFHLLEMTDRVHFQIEEKKIIVRP